MFNLDIISEIAGSDSNSANLTVLTSEHCANLLIAESVQDMARPIRKLSLNERVAEQQKFNRTIALMVKSADNATRDSLQELALQAAQRVQSANQSADEDAILDAVLRLERVVNMFSDLAANVCRNAFYRYEECERMEEAAADSHVEGIDGAIGAFETKSKYAGWKRNVVEADTMLDATDEAIAGLISVIAALLPMTSAYMQSLFTKPTKVNQHVTRGKVHVQLGYQRLAEAKDGEVEYEQYYSRQDVWNSIKSNRKEAPKVMTAEEASASFKL